jgi:hypothetical protein
MNKLVIACLCALAYSTTVLAANVNTGVLYVSAIKANAYAEDNSSVMYYYTFTGDFGGATCGRSFTPRSADENINSVLMGSYVMGTPLKAGIDPANRCIITTVELQHGS